LEKRSEFILVVEKKKKSAPHPSWRRIREQFKEKECFD